MKAKFKVGDILEVTSQFKREGKKLFGDNFRYNNFKSKVTEVNENTNDELDGMGDIWITNYEFENGDVICERFLKLAE